MSVDGSNVTVEKSGLWRTDGAGRTIYYPFGSMRDGYVVDPRGEKALREADQRYRDRSARLWPYGILIGLAVIYTARMLYGWHPFLALICVVLSVLLVVLIEWTCRYISVRPHLQGLAIAPAERGYRLKGYRLKGYGLIAFLCASVLACWCVQHLYGERIAALPPSAEIARFYPSISTPLYFAVFIPFLIFGLFIRREKAAASFGRPRFLSILVIAIIFEVLTIVILASLFYNPEPQVVVTKSFLLCGRPIPWSNVAGLGLRAGRRGKEYVRLDLIQPIHSAYEPTHVSCEIDGLNVDYEDVYKAMAASWQSATQTRQ